MDPSLYLSVCDHGCGLPIYPDDHDSHHGNYHGVDDDRRNIRAGLLGARKSQIRRAVGPRGSKQGEDVTPEVDERGIGRYLLPRLAACSLAQ